jgi:hypothetical protein
MRRVNLPGFVVDLLVPLLLMLPVVWALLPGGLPNTADGPVHFYRAAEFVHGWQDGVLIPRWSQNLGYGYGIPLFVYAPPLPYILTGGLHLLGLPLEAAFKMMMVVGIAIGAFGVYRLGREQFGVWAGAAGAAAFVYAPIQLRELFIQGNVAQYLAWAFPPWAAWAVIRLFRTEQPGDQARYIAILALALMGTLLSHNAASLLLMGMIAGLALLAWLWSGKRWGLWAVAAGSALGMLLSAWFWAPALLEGEYIQLHRIVASDFRPRFIPFAELIALSPPLDTGAINPYFPLTLGAAQVWMGAVGALAALLAAAISLWPRMRTRLAARMAPLPFDRVSGGAALFFVLFAAFCAFMALAWSEPLWATLPFVDLFEWPFRWHGFTALGLSWLCACAVFAVGLVWRPLAPLAGSLALLLLIGSALVNLYPHKVPPEFRGTSPADIVRAEVKHATVGTTSLGEFNPIWIEEPFHTSPLVEDYFAQRPINRLPKQMPPGASGSLVEASAHRQRFHLQLAQPATLTLNLLYFPGWQADVDGAPAAVRPQPASGLLEVELPAGEHLLTLTFADTPLRRAAGLGSLLAWVGLAIIGGVCLARYWMKDRNADASLIGQVRKDKGNPRLETLGRVRMRYVLGFVGLPVALILAAQAGLPGWFQWHSPPDQALPASLPMRADFEDQASEAKIRLLGIDPAAEIASIESTLTVAAYWRALESLDEDYSVFLHLDDPLTGETLATADQRHPADIPTSDWATGLYVRNPLRLLVSPGALPIRYKLRLGVYDRQSDDLLSVAGSGADAVEVGQVWIRDPLRPEPPDGPKAHFGDAIELLGVHYDAEYASLVFYWRTNAPMAEDATIFVHLLDGDGALLGQMDGAPYGNRYALRDWRPQQIIADRRPLEAAGVEAERIHQIAVGVYRLQDNRRLPALDAAGQPLPDNRLLVPWENLAQ